MLGHDHYIHRLRAACIQQPHLNRFQLAALDRELALSRAAPSIDAYLDASAHLLGLARATALDRAANSLDTARRYDDPWSAAAAHIEYLHAQQGANHAELLASIQAGHTRAAALRAQAAEIHAAFLRLFLNLLHVQTSNFELAPAYLEIDTSFRILRQSDPAFLPHTWLDQPRYRLRLPWHAGIIHRWLEPYWDADTAIPPALPKDPGAIEAPAHENNQTWPAAEPLDAPPDTTLADIYLERQHDWPDAFLAAHWQAARQAALAARSPIAQYAVAIDREALFSIESTRNQLELSALLAPLRATANYGWQQDEESRAGLDKAIATAHLLTGLSLPQILASPRIRHFLKHNLQPRLEHGTERFGALAGETGFDLVRHALACQNAIGRVDFNP